MTLYDKALSIATKAHERQKRWNGEPYITHPVAVADYFDDEVRRAAGVCHDVPEDTPLTLDDLHKMLGSAGTQAQRDRVVAAVGWLNHESDETYAEYIAMIHGSRCEDAIAVKIADLKHNLSDLKPGQRRDKYELALMFLEREA